MKSPLWNAFYLHSLQLFKFLEQNSIKLFLEADRVSLDYSKDNYGILSSEKNIGYLDKLSVAPKFMHTICQLNSKNDLYQFEELMVQYHDLFIKAVDKEPPHVKFPFIMPRLLDQDVYQININSNKAFYSKAYRPEDGNVCIKSWHDIDGGHARFDNTTDVAEAALRKLIAAGFTALLVEKEDLRSKSLSLELNIAELCKRYSCSHIQYRKPTGIQYKAQLLYRNEDTVRDSLGVYVLRPQQTVQIYHSLPRKPRKDALFVDNHPDEIQLPLILDARYYRKYLHK